MSQLRMTWSANAPWVKTGYGVQSDSLLPRLAELPEFGGRHALSIFAWAGLEAGVIDDYQGFRIYPKFNDPFGNDVIGLHAEDFGANWVITLIDTWVLHDVAKSVAPALWTPYLPVDHEPAPQMVLDGLEGCYLPLVFSQHGKVELKKAGVDAEYIPLGIEPSVYRILDAAEVERFRRVVMKNPEHLTVMVAANKGFPDRKNFQGQLRAWAEFAKDKPGARLYLHTNRTREDGGLELASLAQDAGILDRCMFPTWYRYKLGYPAQYLSLLYNAADVLMSASMGEGFGIPIVECQSCGTPVIVTNFSSMPELVRWGCKVEKMDDFRTPLNAYQVIPDVAGITDALQMLYAEWEESGKQKDPVKRQDTMHAIHAEYSWDVIVRDCWTPLARHMAEVCPPLAGHFQSDPHSNGLHKLPVSKVDAPPKLKWLGSEETRESFTVEAQA